MALFHPLEGANPGRFVLVFPPAPATKDDQAMAIIARLQFESMAQQIIRSKQGLFYGVYAGVK
jgi:hypothetical protein